MSHLDLEFFLQKRNRFSVLKPSKDQTWLNLNASKFSVLSVAVHWGTCSWGLLHEEICYLRASDCECLSCFIFIPFLLVERSTIYSYDSIPKCSKKPLLNRAVTLSSLPRSCYALLFSYPIIILYVCVNWSIGTPLKFVYSTINQPSATSTPSGSWHTHTHTLHLAPV